MSKPETKGNKREIILETAKMIFAEKGFDGSRMDEIAERAGVKKSLIYYHFDGKDHLLQEILNQFFEEFGELLRSETTSERENNKYMDFMDKNSDLLRVILIESLKKNTKLTSIFKAVNMLMEYENERMDELNPMQYPSNHKRWVAEFFTNMLPSVGYICYKDAWCSYFSVDKETLEKDYFEAYAETHGQYHNNISASVQ